MSTTVHKHKMVITHPALSLTYGHHGTEEGGRMCTCIYVYLFFMAVMKNKREVRVCASSLEWC